MYLLIFAKKNNNMERINHKLVKWGEDVGKGRYQIWKEL